MQRVVADFERAGDPSEPTPAALRTAAAASSAQPLSGNTQPDAPADAPANGATVGPTGKQLVEMNYNTTVYVTGLPDDATVEEVAEEFAKCGVVKTNDDGAPKVKLYRYNMLRRLQLWLAAAQLLCALRLCAEVLHCYCDCGSTLQGFCPSCTACAALAVLQTHVDLLGRVQGQGIGHAEGRWHSHVPAAAVGAHCQGHHARAAAAARWCARHGRR